MNWETLPIWFWGIYYLFLFTTFLTAIISVIKRDKIVFSIVAIVFTVSVPIISLINSIGRTEGMNEFEHLISQIKQGAIWSIYTISGYLFLFVWWVLFLRKNRQVSNDY